MADRNNSSTTDGARIIKLATQIMARGARGWSDALNQARLQVQKEAQHG